MEAVPILEVENLSVSFHTAEGKMNAVRNVSFSIGKGESVIAAYTVPSPFCQSWAISAPAK